MKLGDFLASKDLQELIYGDSVERKGLKNLQQSYDWSFFMNYRSAFLWISVQNSGAMTIHEFLVF